MWLAPVSARENRAALKAKRLRKLHCPPAAANILEKKDEGTRKMNVVCDKGGAVLPFCWGCIGPATGRPLRGGRETSKTGSPQTGEEGRGVAWVE